MSSPSVRLVVFDLGGTTAQLTFDVADVFAEAFEAHGLSVSDDMIATYRGASKREAISRILRASHIDTVDASTIYDDFQQRLLRGLAQGNVRAIPGVEAAFEALRSVDVGVVLTTGFDAVITKHVLNRLGWTGLIDSVVTGDDVAAGRPAPDMILLGMQRVGEVDRNRVAVVGDTVNDIEAGRRAGVKAVVGVLTGAHTRSRLVAAEPTTILPSAADIPEWLRSTAI